MKKDPLKNYGNLTNTKQIADDWAMSIYLNRSMDEISGDNGFYERENISILELTNEGARNWLFKSDSFCSIDLPPYINFEKVIRDSYRLLIGKNLAEVTQSDPRNIDDVNYNLFTNKDGKYAWRPFQIIHPVLYVSLVMKLTEPDNWNFIINRFSKFSKIENIKCLSMPVFSLSNKSDKAERILNWWHEVEQKSIELAIDYDFCIHADITDCYGSIYTHSIAWSMHTKPFSKNNRNDKTLIGNIIDWHIQDMRHGQTNGIPQGSVLMDFIAEMILGYLDIEINDLIIKKMVGDYKILRYRDDYRIFVKNSSDGDVIVKCITEAISDVGFKLNQQKTKFTNEIILNSLKGDKLRWELKYVQQLNPHKRMLIIYEHSIDFPNSGSLSRALEEYYSYITEINKLPLQTKAMISIITEIAFKNPKTYPICSAITSFLLSSLKDSTSKTDIIKKIYNKFSKIQNTAIMLIWLQRTSIKIDNSILYEEKICEAVSGTDVSIWNSEWISAKKLKKSVETKNIIDKETINEMPVVVSKEEVETFSKGIVFSW